MNLKNEHLKEIAKRGGVVVLNACSIINADAGISFRYPFDILSGGHADIPDFLQDMKEHNYSDERISLIAGKTWLYAFEKILKK